MKTPEKIRAEINYILSQNDSYTPRQKKAVENILKRKKLAMMYLESNPSTEAITRQIDFCKSELKRLNDFSVWMPRVKREISIKKNQMQLDLLMYILED